jgi:hypothetical protein
MRPEDRRALITLAVSLSSGLLLMLGPRAFPDVPIWAWQIAFCIVGIVFVGALILLLYDLVARPRLKGNPKLDPLLWVASTALMIGVIALGAYIVRGPNRAPSEVVSATAKTIVPEITLIPPNARHEIIWNPNKNYMPFSGPEGTVNTNVSYTPIFTVKTQNNTSVQDATVRWQTEITGLAKLVKESPNLSAYTIDTTDNNITLMGGPQSLLPFTYRSQDIASSEIVSIPFITNAGANAFIPTNVYNNAALYILALMPDTYGARINPFTFSVTVSWNLPSPGSQKFLVKANIVNAKPPNVSEPKMNALISFEVATIQSP